MEKKKEYGIVMQLENIPGWMQVKVQRLDFVVSMLSHVGPREIKIYSEHRIQEIKAQINEVQNLHQELLNAGIVQLAGQQPGWVALDKMAKVEIENKLELIRTMWDGGGDVSHTSEVIDISKEQPGDDFSEEEEEGSFW